MASTCLVLDQEPQKTTGGPRIPSRVLFCPSQLTRKPFSENGSRSCTNFNIMEIIQGNFQVILSHQGKSTITSKKIYEIMLHAKMESCLRFSRNPVFDDRLKDIEMSYHNVRVQYVINVLRMPLLLRGSVKVSAAARPILREWFPSQLTRTE